jgi:hypothetical protein
LKSELFDGTEPTINLRKLLCGRRDIGIHNWSYIESWCTSSI